MPPGPASHPSQVPFGLGAQDLILHPSEDFSVSPRSLLQRCLPCTREPKTRCIPRDVSLPQLRSHRCWGEAEEVPTPACCLHPCLHSVQLAASTARAHCCSTLGSAAVPRPSPAPRPTGSEVQRATKPSTSSKPPTRGSLTTLTPRQRSRPGSAGSQPCREARGDTAAPLHPQPLLML